MPNTSFAKTLSVLFGVLIIAVIFIMNSQNHIQKLAPGADLEDTKTDLKFSI